MPRLLRRAAIPVLLLLLLALYAWHGGGQDGGRLVDAEGRRVLVADGDTFRIWGDTIRLAGIDAVERTQFCMDERGNAWSSWSQKGDFTASPLSRTVMGGRSPAARERTGISEPE